MPERLARLTDPRPAWWRLISRGIGIRWDALEEDVSVEHLLVGSRG